MSEHLRVAWRKGRSRCKNPPTFSQSAALAATSEALTTHNRWVSRIEWESRPDIASIKLIQLYAPMKMRRSMRSMTKKSTLYFRYRGDENAPFHDEIAGWWQMHLNSLTFSITRRMPWEPIWCLKKVSKTAIVDIINEHIVIQAGHYFLWDWRVSYYQWLRHYSACMICDCPITIWH